MLFCKWHLFCWTFLMKSKSWYCNVWREIMFWTLFAIHLLLGQNSLITRALLGYFLLHQEVHTVWNTGLLTSRDDWGKNSWWKGGPVEPGCPLLWVPSWKTTLWSKESWGNLPQNIKGKAQKKKSLNGIKFVVYLKWHKKSSPVGPPALGEQQLSVVALSHMKALLQSSVCCFFFFLF